MAVFQLRNGLSIDLKFDTPTVFTPQPAKLDFNPKSLYDSALDCHPFPIDGSGQVIPQTNVIKMRASGTLSGASADVFSKCSLRFIQLIKVQSFGLLYFGKRKDEGAVIWEWRGQLLQRNIDCRVFDNGTKDSSPFQFTPEQSEHVAPNVLVGKLGDTPGATIPLGEFNKETKRDNYLRIFNDRRSFESIITFVHADNSTEMLESVKWRFSRSVGLKWVKLAPVFDGTNRIVFTADSSSTSVFGKDAEFADTLKSGRIANRLTTEAMNNHRTSTNVNYTAIEEPNILPPDDFWSP
jgi:hypothetical protein